MCILATVLAFILLAMFISQSLTLRRVELSQMGATVVGLIFGQGWCEQEVPPRLSLRIFIVTGCMFGLLVTTIISARMAAQLAVADMKMRINSVQDIADYVSSICCLNCY